MASIHDNRGLELLAIIWVFTALAVITVILKIFTRARILHTLDIDDFFIFFSLALIVICTSLYSYDVHLGMGKHAKAISVEKVSQAVKVNFIANPFCIMAYSFPNVSIAISLNRLLAPSHIRCWALYSLVSLQCLIAAISCVLLFTQCTPVASLWDSTIPARCFPTGVMTGYSYFTGSFTAVTDIVLGIVPIAAFWKLQMKTKTKVGLCTMMGCTFFAAICAIVKTTRLNELANLEDFTYGTVDLVIWAIVEANVIIIAASVPTLRPFFQLAFKNTNVSEGRSIFRRLPNVLSLSLGSNGSLLRSKRNREYGKSTSEEHIARGPSTELEAKRLHEEDGRILRTVDIEASWSARVDV